VTSVKKQITVETTQQRAFRVFTEGVNRWWPREHHAAPSPLERIVIEPRTGGRWYSVCQDGSEINVGKVLDWQPPGRLVLAWQLTAQFTYDPDFVTELEVNFVAEGPRTTRVELEHKYLERYGDAAEQMRTMFEDATAWAHTLEQFGGAVPAPKFLMTYEAAPDGHAKAPTHLAAHVARLDDFQRRGHLLMAGPVLDGTGRAFGVFTSKEAADDFIREDPFIVHGVVAKSSVVPWNEVLA